MENQIKYLEEVNEKILNPLTAELIAILVKFIESDSQSLIIESASNDYKLEVVNIEFDMPFSFSYVAYPGSNRIPNEFINTMVLDIDYEDGDELHQIFRGNGFVEGDDNEWYNDVTSQSIDEWELCKYMECLWFHKCWQEAKGKDSGSSSFRCFFIEHEVLSGIDADSGSFLSEDQIQQLLIKEGLFTEPHYESKYIVHKDDGQQLWGTPIENFEDFEPALEYLKDVVKNSGEERASEKYLIRKWLKMAYVSPGQDPWVIDGKFGKRFI